MRLMQFFFVVSFLLLLCLMASSYTSAMPANNTSVLHFVAFVPYLKGGGPAKPDHFGYKAAIQMAIESINNRSDILPNYTIQVEYGETWVSNASFYSSLPSFPLSIHSSVGTRSSHLKEVRVRNIPKWHYETCTRMQVQTCEGFWIWVQASVWFQTSHVFSSCSVE